MVPPLSPWELFVLRHRKPGNLVVHFVSFLCFWGGPLLALITWSPWWLAAFFASGAIGAAGHWMFDDGGVSLRESTSRPDVVWYVGLMFLAIARGRYAGEIERALAKAEAAGYTVDRA